jgi:hypothetical protein
LRNLASGTTAKTDGEWCRRGKMANQLDKWRVLRVLCERRRRSPACVLGVNKEGSKQVEDILREPVELIDQDLDAVVGGR